MDKPQEPQEPPIDFTARLPEDARSMAEQGDLLLIFTGPQAGTLKLHRTVLELASEPLREMLGTAGPVAVTRLPVDDSPDSWLAVVPFLYPRYAKPAPQLCWANVLPVLEIAHKYDMQALLQPCCECLTTNSKGLSTEPASPRYVLKWLEAAERLQLDSVKDKCIKFITGDDVKDAISVSEVEFACHSCGTRPGHSGAIGCRACVRGAHGEGFVLVMQRAPGAQGREDVRRTRRSVLADGPALARLSRQTLEQVLAALALA